jgi:hypothetical protein
MAHFNAYLDAVQTKVREAGAVPSYGMGTDDYEHFIRTALRRYSRDKANIKVANITGTSVKYIEINGTTLPKFIDGFSKINYIEAAAATVADNDPPNFIERDNWDYYRDATKLYIYLKDDAPGASDIIRVQYTVEHTITGLDAATVDTVPSFDFEAVVYWAVSEALLALAGKYADSTDPTLRADVVNYQSKSRNYLAVAKVFRELYVSWITDTYIAASATRDLDFGLSIGDGQPYQTHRSFSRN